jgi:hypothetical protein
MTKSLSESKSVANDNKAGERMIQMYVQRRCPKMMMVPKKKK